MTHQGTIKGFSTDLASSGGNGHTTLSIRNWEATKVVTSNILVRFVDELVIAPEGEPYLD